MPDQGVYWQRTGFCLWLKRLEEERFKWPYHLEGPVVEFNEEQFFGLLDGLDLKHLKPLRALEYRKVLLRQCACCSGAACKSAIRLHTSDAVDTPISRVSGTTSELPDDIDALKTFIGEKTAQLREMEMRVAVLEEQLRLAAHKHCGASSEKADPAQLGLFNEAESLSRASAADNAATSDATITVSEHTRAKCGRKPFPAACRASASSTSAPIPTISARVVAGAAAHRRGRHRAGRHGAGEDQDHPERALQVRVMPRLYWRLPGGEREIDTPGDSRRCDTDI